MESVFTRYANQFVERGISVIPIAPNTKKPGSFTKAHGWRGMSDWTRFTDRLPTELELLAWSTWPDAQIGVVLGRTSKIIALDKDYDLNPKQEEILQSIIPMSPVAKKGEKGWTRFYRYNGERSCSFDVHGKRVLDILSDGRQTVMPPSVHPNGCTYVYITPAALDDFDIEDLPQLPDDFIQQVQNILAPFQTEDDLRVQRKVVTPIADGYALQTGLSIQQQYFAELNAYALANMDLWVPKLVPTAKREGEGYRCVATWRGGKGMNVGIHPTGIRDWAGQYGMSCIDLMMYSSGLSFMEAADSLGRALSYFDTTPVTLTINGKATMLVGATSAVVHPWQKIPPAQVLQLPPDEEGEAPVSAIPTFITDPPGILRDISNWITATAPKPQPELSTAAAIALAAAVMQRIYVSDKNNFTSLYTVMVAKSTEGKEHPQACVERALVKADMANLLAGSGYTSSGAVFSALIKQPNHLAIIDEIGKLIKMSRAKGNSNSEAAIDKLVEAFGKLHSTIRPPIYSTMTLSKKQAADMNNTDLIIYNPAISVLGATTPATFFGNLTDDLVSDGFLGRLLVVESSQPRQLARLVPSTDPPARIIDWMKAVHAPAHKQGSDLAGLTLSEAPAVTTGMTFKPACEAPIRDFEIELNKLKDQFESERLDVLLGRTFEKALRLSMIAAKARSMSTLEIEVEDVLWAIQYVRHYDMALIRAVRKHRVSSQVDGDIKKAVEYIKGSRRIAAEKANEKFAHVLSRGMMPHQLLLKRMHMNKKQFDELIDTAITAGVIGRMPGEEFHYAGYVYCSLDES